ncbi:MAG: hypothetical protein P8R54_08570 [Myxococcota bacterium]|nr:hypothetical protein [Myxococcota bacterium]
MHQPQVADLRPLFSIGLLACKPEPPEHAPAAGLNEPTVWQMRGRLVSSPSISSAPPFQGAEALLERCSRPPCAAELWRTERGETATVLVHGETLTWGEQSWPASWKRLGTELSWCLEGGPLSSPPAGDPGGFRLLAATDPPSLDRDARWLLHFGGTNTCALSGELILYAHRDQVDSRGLSSGGLPWSKGGRANALEILKANAEALR